jgi:hypothetical protein
MMSRWVYILQKLFLSFFFLFLSNCEGTCNNSIKELSSSTCTLKNTRKSKKQVHKLRASSDGGGGTLVQLAPETAAN